jgi:hypothetical protein
MRIYDHLDSNSQCMHCVLLILFPSGCGVHIHTGTSCADTTTIGGLYYEDPVLSNPWTNERYTTSESTTSAGFYDGDFQGVLEIGATAIEGRVFVGKYRCIEFDSHWPTRLHTYIAGYANNHVVISLLLVLQYTARMVALWRVAFSRKRTKTC